MNIVQFINSIKRDGVELSDNQLRERYPQLLAAITNDFHAALLLAMQCNLQGNTAGVEFFQKHWQLFDKAAAQLQTENSMLLAYAMQAYARGQPAGLQLLSQHTHQLTRVTYAPADYDKDIIDNAIIASRRGDTAGLDFLTKHAGQIHPYCDEDDVVRLYFSQAVDAFDEKQFDAMLFLLTQGEARLGISGSPNHHLPGDFLSKYFIALCRNDLTIQQQKQLEKIYDLLAKNSMIDIEDLLAEEPSTESLATVNSFWSELTETISLSDDNYFLIALLTISMLYEYDEAVSKHEYFLAFEIHLPDILSMLFDEVCPNKPSLYYFIGSALSHRGDNDEAKWFYLNTPLSSPYYAKSRQALAQQHAFPPLASLLFRAHETTNVEDIASQGACFAPRKA